jgi:hypothetical protein
MQASEEKAKKKKLKKKKAEQQEETPIASEVPKLADEVPKPTPSSSASTLLLQQTASSQAEPDHRKVTYYCSCICSVKITF